MNNINDIKKAVGEFLKKTLEAKDVRMIKTARVGDGWEAEAEVYGEGSFIKSLGLTPRVGDRNIYLVKINDELDVEYFELEGQHGHG